MKKISIYLLLTLVLISRNSDDDAGNDNVIGKWKLIGQWVDPGDGSGVFQPVFSNLTLHFLQTGNVTATNGSFCSIYTQPEGSGSGTFSLDTNTIETECTNGKITISFEIKDGNLILYFPCIEGCAQKYSRTF